MNIKFLEYCVRNPWPVLISTVLICALFAVGMKNLAMSNDYRNFFSEENPELQAFEFLQNTYNKSDNVLFVITPKDGKVFTPKTLESIQWLTEEAWQTPFSSRVDSITNYQHTSAVEDDLSVEDLVDDTNLTERELSDKKFIAINEPLLLNRLINADASVTAVNVTVQLPGEDLEEAPIVAKFARELSAKLESQDSNIEVRMTGIVMMNNAFGEASIKDFSSLVPGMFVVVAIVLGFMLKSASLTFATIVVFALSVVTALGVAGWRGVFLDPLMISAPTIILTMAVADSVHLLSSYLNQLRAGLVKIDAMLEALRINFSPIFITSVTTALGFLSMNFSEIPPLNNMGNTVAIGVFVAFILSVTFLPALTMVLPSVKVTDSVDKQNHLQALSHWVVEKRGFLLSGMIVASLLVMVFVPDNQINDEFVNYFDERVEFRTDTEYAAEHLVGPYTVEYSFSSDESEGIADPNYLVQLEQFVAHLKSYEEVVHVNSFSDIMRRLNKNMHGDDPEMYKMPETREMAAQFLLLYEMSLPYGLDLNDQIDVDRSATRITMSTINLSSKRVLEMENSINQWITDNLEGITVQASSPNLMFAHIGMRNAKSLTMGAILALFLISIIMIVALRSFKMGLISLLPNLLPAGIAFGIWGLIDGQVGMSVSIVIGMTLGIVVDDSVHFLSKYLRARREKGLDAIEATHYAFATVGNALVVTTLVLIIGFLVLTLSTFKMNADMGLVTALTIGAALIIDFLLLPPLLMALDKTDYKVKADQTEGTSNTEATHKLTADDVSLAQTTTTS